MKKKIVNILLVSLFLVGLSLLLYPTASNLVNTRNQTRAMTEYEVELENLDEKEYRAVLEAARQYNRELLKKPNRYVLTADELREYRNQLLVAGSKLMGMLEIGKIGVKLPIYHGTSEGVLQIGIGHLEGSSLPVGGPDTHAVITGHSGLPEAKLLTDLNKLNIGEPFTLHVLGEKLTYTVDQILVVEPSDTEAIAIEQGKDFCTIITCTPYGINSHRLLVRGVREQSDQIETVTEETDVTKCQCQCNCKSPILCLILLLLMLLILLLCCRKKRQEPTDSKQGGDCHD